MGDAIGIVGKMADHLIDAVDPDGRKVVAQGTKVAFGVRKQSGIHVPLDQLALNFPGWCAPIQAPRPGALSVRFHPLDKDTRGGHSPPPPPPMSLFGSTEPNRPFPASAADRADPVAGRQHVERDHVRLQFGVEDSLPGICGLFQLSDQVPVAGGIGCWVFR